MTIENLKKEVIDLANDVYNELGSGYSESVYENAMKVGLRFLNICYEDQKTIELTYKSLYVGEGNPDIIIRTKDGDVIIELKAISGKVSGKEEAQLKSYMKILNIKNGLLINMQAPGSNLEKGTVIEIKELSL